MKETISSSKRIILGVDPGTTIMGYGLITVNGKKMELLHMDELVMNSKENHYLRLQKIFEKTIEIIDKFHPDEMALEAPFFGKCQWISCKFLKFAMPAAKRCARPCLESFCDLGASRPPVGSM